MFVKFLYFYLDGLTSSLLYTDNRNLTNTDRQSETIAIVEANLHVVAQLSDDVQFTVGGSIIYLPLQNVLAIEESSELGGGPGFLFARRCLQVYGTISYNTEVNGVPIQFLDVFSTATGGYSNGTRDSFALFQNSVVESGNSSTYRFRSQNVQLRPATNSVRAEANDSNSNPNFDQQSQQDYFNLFSNTAFLSTQGYLPGDLYGTAEATRSDFFYTQRTSQGLPSSRDEFFASVQGTRPNMRFTPFASYDARYTDGNQNVSQFVKAGLTGPDYRSVVPLHRYRLFLGWLAASGPPVDRAAQP